MADSKRQKNPLVKRQPLAKGEWVVFVWRLVISCLVSPLATYAYLRAMYIERLYNPREFTQALLLRLGRNARVYDLDPMSPRPVAHLVYQLGNEPPMDGRLDVDVGDNDGNTNND